MTHPTEQIIVRDSQLVRNTLVGLIVACTSFFGWGMYTLNAHDKVLAGDDVRWAEQVQKHAAIDSCQAKIDAHIADIDLNLQRIKDELVSLRRDLAVRNLAASPGKEQHGND
jgi:hypothetical protein